MKQHNIQADWTEESLTLHTQTVLQGAFILAKANVSAHVAVDSVGRLRRYVEPLFRQQSIQHLYRDFSS